MTSQDGNSPPVKGPSLPAPSVPAVPKAVSEPPWNPPLRLWQLFLLFFLTFGLQGLFWTGRFAGDMNRHLDPRIRPWLYVLGQLIPLGTIFVAHLMASQIDQLKSRSGLKGGPPHWLIVMTAVVVAFLTMGSNRISEDDDQLIILGFSGLILVWSWPWLLLQYQLNRHKATLANPEWLARPFRFSWPQRGAVATGGLLWCTIGTGLFLLQIPDSGTRLAAREQVSGQPLVYNLTVSSNDWQVMPPGTIEVGADLELYGEDTGMFAVVFVGPLINRTLDQFVIARREIISEGASDLESEETRVIAGQAFAPVSFTRYSSAASPIIDASTWWVATAVHNGVYVEVIAYATGEQDSDRVRQVRSLAHSLRLQQ